MTYIFLDVDGVLNSQLHYESKQFTDYKSDKNDDDYQKSQISSIKIQWLNDLCTELNASVVISAGMRLSRSVKDLQEIFNLCGATFEIIGKTDYLGYERGIEISKWLKDNIKLETHGVYCFDFQDYVIIDDDDDMLLSQRNNFFQTDPYVGLTPTICENIKKFITGLTFRK